MLNRKNVASSKSRTLVAYSHPESVLSEQYNMIHANIKFAMNDKNSRTFLITSPSNGEGKTTVAANLAVSMAQQNEKVLLIDANLRNPYLHSIFNISNSIGLTNVLTGSALLEEVIYHTEIRRLDILPSGLATNNPVELLGSKLMDELLNNASQRYDVVLIDSHSVLEIIDTKLLANHCDGVVLVIKKGKTNSGKAKDAKKVLEFAKAKIVGAVLNG
ncbi:CpsD/CapB family tyrosine-protein kinase [Neobacillus sp. PS3-34]|uniref:CpsD/CapB family tyrosine-protein kinase n=1 Tax=Neobacillus sp. PS3-34 TaxID=3070678 RepID=UPI0027DF28B5|nr:CpsD/CapB family tyrosine-protein kinase [Neobacillus sp. PS3-34]WML47795.1 CpsD/CapB family tyrosine-protein kinase [Neobacillus sp. PS3-34]